MNVHNSIQQCNTSCLVSSVQNALPRKVPTHVYNGVYYDTTRSLRLLSWRPARFLAQGALSARGRAAGGPERSGPGEAQRRQPIQNVLQPGRLLRLLVFVVASKKRVRSRALVTPLTRTTRKQNHILNEVRWTCCNSKISWRSSQNLKFEKYRACFLHSLRRGFIGR